MRNLVPCMELIIALCVFVYARKWNDVMCVQCVCSNTDLIEFNQSHLACYMC